LPSSALEFLTVSSHIGTLSILARPFRVPLHLNLITFTVHCILVNNV
jgi:hypothetical protein